MFNTISIYSVALFVHIVGALGLFVALGLEWASLSYLRRAATVEQARLGLSMWNAPRRLYPISWLAILIPGFYMAATAWRAAAWIPVALGAVILIAVLGAVLAGRRVGPISKQIGPISEQIGPISEQIGPADQSMAVESGPISPTLRQRLDDPLLWASLRIRTAIALGIVFLMTAKPGLPGSLLTLSVAAVLGLVFSLPILRRDQEKVQASRASDSL